MPIALRLAVPLRAVRWGACLAGAPFALALVAPAMGQAVTEFRLPPGASPRAAGPVDADSAPPAPATRAPAPAPAAPAATPPAAPTAVPTLAIPPATTPVPRRSEPPGRTAPPSPAPAATAPTPVAPSPKPTAVAAVPGPVSGPVPGPGPVPVPVPVPVANEPASPVPSPVPSPVTAPQPSSSGIAWWWLLPAALLGAGLAWLLLARRPRPVAAPDFVPPRPVTHPQPNPQTEPAPPPAETGDPLDLLLEPLRFSVTLVNATLQYRLTLANRAATPTGPLYIAADMIAAHASLPEESQLARDGCGLELRHEVASLAPGETAEWKGDLRLPLADVTPIRAGPATLLVPLVRLRVEGDGASRTVALVVGEPPVNPGGPLRPFRLDLGPRIFGAISQRTLPAAA